MKKHPENPEAPETEPEEINGEIDENEE